MTDPAQRPRFDWDILLRFAAPLLTMTGILVGVWQFNAGEEHRRVGERDAALQRDEIEFRRRLWLERLDIYRKITEMAGRIAAGGSTPEERRQAAKEFQAAYWGAMVLVEDKPVRDAMIEIEAELHDFDAGHSDLQRLQYRVNALAEACRRSLNAGSPTALAADGARRE
ncbi:MULTISPECIES: hypothetical protein [unclassified Novosphingobium]|uniref:hypothetical protein n=1 Tax=unclassified Novosphingobium TaxID=2644732 RepID=UPI0013570B4B|nr:MULTISPECIES: hypothetical protein [unclassified Novosphingobium]